MVSCSSYTDMLVVYHERLFVDTTAEVVVETLERDGPVSDVSLC